MLIFADKKTPCLPCSPWIYLLSTEDTAGTRMRFPVKPKLENITNRVLPKPQQSRSNPRLRCIEPRHFSPFFNHGTSERPKPRVLDAFLYAYDNQWIFVFSRLPIAFPYSRKNSSACSNESFCTPEEFLLQGQKSPPARPNGFFFPVQSFFRTHGSTSRIPREALRYTPNRAGWHGPRCQNYLP